ALLARWGLRVDHKKISVAQLAAELLQEPSMPRLVIGNVSVDMNMRDQRIVSTVTLSIGNQKGSQEISGHYVGPYLGGHNHHAVAQATLDAINQLEDLSYAFAIEDLKVVSLSGNSVVLVAITQFSRLGRSELLVGSAIDSGDGYMVAARATLDAVNRRLSLLHAPAPCIPLAEQPAPIPAQEKAE
ncbi:MAG: hypothetical protein OWS74_09295, partial [Firmicutes bacterium]|nr:hypothetical protein [Bacillota bacterium]